ncbi:MAG: hypothetical protein NTX76_01825 [Alphaproteobacteria bacterium]|nr:hypothetical protein [Alphaproteobacteria bacterium]
MIKKSMILALGLFVVLAWDSNERLGHAGFFDDLKSKAVGAAGDGAGMALQCAGDSNPKKCMKKAIKAAAKKKAAELARAATGVDPDTINMVGNMAANASGHGGGDDGDDDEAAASSDDSDDDETPRKHKKKKVKKKHKKKKKKHKKKKKKHKKKSDDDEASDDDAS